MVSIARFIFKYFIENLQFSQLIYMVKVLSIYIFILYVIAYNIVDLLNPFILLTFIPGANIASYYILIYEFILFGTSYIINIEYFFIKNVLISLHLACVVIHVG